MHRPKNAAAAWAGAPVSSRSASAWSGCTSARACWPRGLEARRELEEPDEYLVALLGELVAALALQTQVARRTLQRVRVDREADQHAVRDTAHVDEVVLGVRLQVRDRTQRDQRVHAELVQHL